ncbi:nitrous oxide reductase accessory protein NosL [Sphingobacterium sp. BN32]|uniref:nitrous oxide reductase accessory protein NosL n=1 Tax=Sphingobacterium sp. BN32 TaxID=3058432 RepID=UPI00265CBA23|nr:nitrous oxide reductase accessory protein NosL [Sphingobacterium sp. BN32]WKK59517.1 nitrous oxide reductase accessory protein NosL [Sphingobacterium sp. BN32]
MKSCKILLLCLSSVMLLMFGLQACQGNNEPKPIKYGSDQCAYCKMTVSDPRFGTQLLTKKGRAYNFDDVQCMVAFVKENQVKKEDVAVFFLPDYSTNKLLPAEKMFYLKSEKLKSPMRGDIAAFSDSADLEKTKASVGGTTMTWDDLWK